MYIARLYRWLGSVTAAPAQANIWMEPHPTGIIVQLIGLDVRARGMEPLSRYHPWDSISSRLLMTCFAPLRMKISCHVDAALQTARYI